MSYMLIDEIFTLAGVLFERILVEYSYTETV